LSDFLARTFHGLTARRIAVLAGFILVMSVFSFPVAVTYARGLDLRETMLVLALGYVGRLMWIFAGLFAAIAAYNRWPGGTPARAVAAAIATGLVLWYARPYTIVLMTASIRDAVDLPVVPAAAHWLSAWMVVAMAAAALIVVTRNEDLERSVAGEAKRVVDLDRAVDEAVLQATQAQIEPHFLFNTLANIRRLYQVDPGAARAMLRQFGQMLRATLQTMRDDRSTLQRELAVAVAYLSVQKIRMGDRLRFDTRVPGHLHAAHLPPMMLSTLVENAIKHGLAPLERGGSVSIVAEATDGMLRVRVEDTGRGLTESAGAGLGLANIEARLAAMYGDAGALSLEPNEPAGVVARITVPLRFVGDTNETGGVRVVA
jgi:signal transduction histidine kinase